MKLLFAAATDASNAFCIAACFASVLEAAFVVAPDATFFIADKFGFSNAGHCLINLQGQGS